MASLFLWVDDTLVRHGEGYRDSVQIFEYADTRDRPAGFLSYFSDDRQFVAEGENEPNSVFINGTEVEQNLTGSPKLLIDNKQGRVLVSSDVGTSAEISGNFRTKEINTYMVDETEEDLIVNSEFTSSGESYLTIAGKNGQNRYTLPALFLSKTDSTNKPFALGGMDDTRTNVRGILMSENLYEADATTSILRDCARRVFKLIPYENYPYGRYSAVIDHPYTYTGLSDEYGESVVFVDEVNAYKLTDLGKSKLSQDLHVNFIDFELSTPRVPRSQFNN